MISYNEALSIIQEEFKTLELQTEEVELLDSVDRILAEDIYSDINLPPFDNSAMDGIAIQFNPYIKKWNLIGEIPAGKFSEFRIDDGNAVSIMTGGKLPSGCDTVIPIEDIEIQDGSASLIDDARFSRGINIRSQGEDLLKGAVALEQNTKLRPHHIAVAASCGKSIIKVYKRLRIGVMATGDELIDINETPTEDKIRSSNQYALLSAVREMNMTAVNLGRTQDDRQLIQDKLASALDSDLDILVTSGGVSVGKFDYVKEVHEQLGVDVKFWGVMIKPGKPALFGTYRHGGRTTLVFGLPGNPVSSLVNFSLFVQQNIYSLFDLKIPVIYRATLQDDLKKKDAKRHFMRGFCTYNENGKFQVKKIGSQSSGNLAEMGKANCLIVVEEERINPKKGESVECIMI